MLANNLTEKTDAIVESEFRNHPFETGISSENFERVIREYLAMSMGFPYLQAGSMARLFNYALENGLDIERDVAITSVVGAFLTWDETGGHATVQSKGNAGLPDILKTERFHSNLLREDIKTLTGKSLGPGFSQVTKNYLRKLGYGLSSIDPVTRVAYMVAFEKHAGLMIEALWESAAQLFKADKDDLVYFNTHVGGDDPAEEYHVRMTARMIQEVISETDAGRFVDFFREAYELNYEWCHLICETEEAIAA